jgi:hypothetical protein
VLGAVHLPSVQGGLQIGRQFLLFFGSLEKLPLHVHVLGAEHFPLVQGGLQTGMQFMLFFRSLL